jgi:hypothetical protein
MSQLLIQKYLNEFDRYKKFSRSSTEGVTSEAFKDLLKAWAKQNNPIFINQYEFQSPRKNRIRPDGTILHDLRAPLGYLFRRRPMNGRGGAGTLSSASSSLR